MLMVISRVTSAMVRTLTPRLLQASRSVSSRSAGFFEPMFGGTCSSSGPITSARPASHAFHFGQASASFFDQRDISSWVRFWSSS